MGIAVLLCIITLGCIRRIAVSSKHDTPRHGSGISGTRCSDIPVPYEYWVLDSRETAAFVDIANTNAIAVGGTVCVRVVIPAKESMVPAAFTPLPMEPWDSVLLDLVGNSTGISVPVDLKPVTGPHSLYRDTAHVYEADVRLRDVDVFKPEGYIEFRHARWNPDGVLDPQPFEPEMLEIPQRLQIQVTGDPILGFEQYMNLPLCTSASAEGRWVSVRDIPANVAVLLMPPDNQNRVWMPYDCRLRSYAYRDFAQCLVDKYPVLHWFGDSNTRRALKKVTSLGEWCNTAKDRASHLCICNDNTEQYARYNSNARIAPIDIDPVHGGVAASSIDSPVPNNRSRIVAFKWDGLTDRNQPAWADPFDRADGLFTKPLPAAVIIGVINWDTAFSTRSFFANEVNRLIQKVRSTYPPSTLIIIRTGQYYCCTSDMNKFWKRRYSRLRNRHYNRYIVEQFTQLLPPTYRFLVWDVSSMAEKRPYAARHAEINFCPANHVPSEIVDIENQILINAMCN
ncbi:hypothetical protein EV175_001524 [Coemansia sp. RSA 1933]|nr:hypothetical protein EV175_001524 [Coemansia sp. RSA 1933]